MIKTDPLAADTLSGIFRTSPKDPFRIINREGTTIEFKESYSHSGMAQYFKTMAAFANNSGGYIIFGVADKPRRLIGLSGKHLNQFEDLRVEDVTRNLSMYLSPEIMWDHCTFEFKNLSFGVLYTYPLRRKPCICKKAFEASNPKYSLKEGDVYYRYGGRSERIHYEELAAIIENVRKNEEKQWLEFAKNAAKIGVENACLLDLNTGVISDRGGTIILDDSLVSKISFIKQGEFFETKGAPALRLIGDIESISTGRIVVKETTKKVVRAIETNEIVLAFLTKQNVDNPLEYIRALCASTSSYYPVYYFLHQSGASIAEVIDIVKGTTSRGQTKKKLLERLNGRLVPQTSSAYTGTHTSDIKKQYREQVLNETSEFKYETVNQFFNAVMSLDNNDIVLHEAFIKRQLLLFYQEYYEGATSIIASNFRKTICRIDEALYLNLCH